MKKKDIIFEYVKALPNYFLEVNTGAGNKIYFDFKSRLNTVRFGELKDTEIFETASTDGEKIIFKANGKPKMEIDYVTFVDLLFVDRTKV